MNDLEIKQALLETCPVRPGQEARAWDSFQNRLQGKPSRFPLFLRVPWLIPCGGAAALVLFALVFDSPSVAPASATSQSPGIFATAFYSQSAKAQVVWLNGMDPATDRPTYMDPTTKVDPDSENAPNADKL
jgi:hypothetical protein